MLIPIKHENLEKNVLVLGADIIFLLRRRTLDVETLFQELKNIKNINLEQFYSTITFLWLADTVNLSEQHTIFLKK